MNETIQWLTPVRGSTHRAANTPDLWLRLSTMTSPEGAKHRRQVAITIYADMMRALRLVAGDKMRIGIMPDGSVAMRRVASGGYTLTPTGDTKEQRREVAGQPVTSVLKFTFDADLGRRSYGKSELILRDDGTVIIPLTLV